MAEYINRDTFLEKERAWYCKNCIRRMNSKGKIVYEIREAPCRACDIGDVLDALEDYPAADVVELPETGIGDLSDGYHTFNGLYEQRMILFSALVKAYKDRAWKSYRHEDGEYCFGGGWFIVGIDTPEGTYTYHYENKFWDMFDCPDLPRAKHWDGHTEADAETRLMSLPDVVERKTGKWEDKELGTWHLEMTTGGFAETWRSTCSICSNSWENLGTPNYCPNCGARMIGGDDDGA